MTSTFNIATLGFVHNLTLTEKYAVIGATDIEKAIADDQTDYSEVLGKLSSIIAAVGQGDFDLDSIFTVKTEPVPGTSELKAQAMYGCTVRASKEGDQLLLCFAGENNFEISQSGKTLTCGTLTGDIAVDDIEDSQTGKVLKTVLKWSASIDDEIFFEIPILTKSEDANGEPIVLSNPFVAKYINKPSNLLAYAQPIGAGGVLAIKAKDLGAGIYKVVEIECGTRTVKDTGDEFFYADLTLDDGRVGAANSSALGKLKDLHESGVRMIVPCEWVLSPVKNGMSSSLRVIAGSADNSTPKQSFIGMLGKAPAAPAIAAAAAVVAESKASKAKVVEGEALTNDLELKWD